MCVLCNHIILGMPLHVANHPHRDIVELHWISRNLAQLIGRTAIRKHEGIPVNIHLYVIDEYLVYYLRESFFYGCNIIIHKTQTKKKTQSAIVLQLISEKTSTDSTINVSTILSQFYTSKKSQDEFLRRNKKQLLDIAKQSHKHYKKPRGKNAIIS